MGSLTRWDPFGGLNSLQYELDRVFGRSWDGLSSDSSRTWVPATEITSDEEGCTVQMALPGVDPKRVDVEVAENVLTVKGERKTKTNNENSYVSEFGQGSFTRSFRLPNNIDAEKVAANFEHGMLELRLPLVEAAKPRRITVTSAA
tara:strand:- start:3644 stop:4081 length:438 start_codon:yes stop_codon:yes gene_type:complete